MSIKNWTHVSVSLKNYRLLEIESISQLMAYCTCFYIYKFYPLLPKIIFYSKKIFIAYKWYFKVLSLLIIDKLSQNIPYMVRKIRVIKADVRYNHSNRPDTQFIFYIFIKEFIVPLQQLQLFFVQYIIQLSYLIRIPLFRGNYFAVF